MIEAIETTETTPAPSEAENHAAAPENPAVARCMSVWKHAYQRELAKGQSDFMASHIAGQAYRRAMPPLAGQENIRDFIACVAYGLLIGAIDQKYAANLLYAAQVAHTTIRNQSATSKTAAV